MKYELKKPESYTKNMVLTTTQKEKDFSKEIDLVINKMRESYRYNGTMDDL